MARDGEDDSGKEPALGWAAEVAAIKEQRNALRDAVAAIASTIVGQSISLQRLTDIIDGLSARCGREGLSHAVEELDVTATLIRHVHLQVKAAKAAQAAEAPSEQPAKQPTGSRRRASHDR